MPDPWGEYDDYDEIIASYNRGERTSDIVDRLGLSPMEVRNAIYAHKSQERADAYRADQLAKGAARAAAEADHIRTKQERARLFAEAWAEGETLDSIGQRNGITRERVRQIINSDPVRRAEAEAARTARKLAEAARNREIQEQRKRKIDRRMSVYQPKGANPRVYPNEVMVRMLQEWASALPSGVQPTGSHWDRDRDYDTTPAAITFIQRYGTWSDALMAAGLAPIRLVYRADRVPTQKMLDDLVAFLSDPDETLGGIAAYERWAKRHGATSAASIRVRFGGWSAAKSKAIAVVQATPSQVDDTSEGR